MFKEAVILAVVVNVVIGDDSSAGSDNEEVMLLLGGAAYPTKATVFNDTHCTIKDLPKESYVGAGAQLDGRPLYCGGYENDFNVTTPHEHGDCFQLQVNGEWSKFGSLKVARSGHAAVKLKNQRVWVTGGGSYPYTDSTEIVHANGTVIFGPNLPKRVRGHCMVKADNGLIFSTGGYQVGGNLNDVWIYNENLKLIDSTSKMQRARSHHGCNVVHSSTHGGRQIVIVVDGCCSYSGARGTAEILDFSVFRSSWVLLPDLPMSFGLNPGVFQLPRQNDVVIFSNDGVVILTMDSGSYIYKTLANADLYPRDGFVAMMVPKSALKCYARYGSK